MKKSLYFIFLLSAAMMFFSCSLNSSCDSDSRADTDWLCLFYFDADDDSLNDYIFQNLVELEVALGFMMEDKNTPKAGFPSVKFLVLWDGYGVQGNKKYYHPDGALYELGPDFTTLYTDEKGVDYSKITKFELCENSQELTENVSDWLPEEPDMASEKTLTDFLKWAKQNYSAKNTLLVLSDHGAGTYKEIYDDTLGSKTQSLCCDASNSGSREGADLSCKNVTNAITAAGLKVNLLCFDVCLEATCEIVNCLSGCTDYFITSPALSYSHDFTYIFKNMKKSYEAIDLGKLFVSEYYHSYGVTAVDCPEKEADAHRSSGYSMYTQTLFNLSSDKVSAMKSAVDSLAKSINVLDEDTKKYLFTEYLQQDYQVYDNCKGIAYQGTYVFLNDIGFFVKNIIDDISLQTLSDLQTSARNLKTLLKHGDDNLIVYAYAGKKGAGEHIGGKWDVQTYGQWYMTGAWDFISRKSVPVQNDDDIFGITIVTQDLWDTIDIVENYMEYTGFSSEWEKLIKYWDEKVKPKFKP